MTAEILMSSEVVTLPAGHVLHADEGAGTGFVFFPHRGVISVRSNDRSGAQVEIAAVGREGAFGLVALLGVPLLPMLAEITIETRAARITLARFQELAEQWPEAGAVLRAYLGTLFRTLVRLLTCYRFHGHDQWVARWVLATADKAGCDTLPITHEVIAQRLGSQRHGVSASLAHLRAAGAISSERGQIVIENRARLTEFACSCYDAPGRTGAGAQAAEKTATSGEAVGDAGGR
jgi:CRP-like cAMP-binding protein